MKRSGLSLACFGIYLCCIALLLSKLDDPSLLPPEFSYVDVVSDMLMFKFGLVIALFGILAFFSANAAHAARRVRTRLE